VPIRSAVRTFRAAFFLLRTTNFRPPAQTGGRFFARGGALFIHCVMPGLVPGIHDWQHRHMAGGWVYITTNRPQGTLYVGVTADIAQRIQQHRDGVVDSFTKRYGLKRLVYAE
jgi:hypothetical protein